MVGSSGMKLVFRLRGVGFALSLNDLVEVGEGLSALVALTVAVPVAGESGSIKHRGIAVPLHDIGARLGLGATDLATANMFLVLIGADSPWALAIDQVVGIFPAADFVSVPVLNWYFQEQNRLFDTLVIWQAEPLILCEALPFEQALGGR